MPIPLLLFPSSLPRVLSTDHSVDLTSQYANTRMTTGHQRKRRAFTTAPKVFNIALDLSQEQATVFYDWFEGPLRAGYEEFAIELSTFGPDLILWYGARFLEPYTATPDVTGRWRISAKLLVTEAGQEDGPDSSALEAAYGLAFGGSATLTVQPALQASYAVRFEGLELLAAVNYGIAFWESDPEPIEFLLQEDDFALLTEDNFNLLLE